MPLECGDFSSTASTSHLSSSSSMTLRIGKLATRCLAPRGQGGAGELVDAVARETLPRELSERLGPSLDRQPAVVRLRRLERDGAHRASPSSKRGGLAGAWANAVARALHEALARPDRRRREDCAVSRAARPMSRR